MRPIAIINLIVPGKKRIAEIKPALSAILLALLKVQMRKVMLGW